jgi:DNA-binding response OmpR family regulator
MPDLGGEAVAQLIRASDAPWSRVPVIVVSADTAMSDPGNGRTLFDAVMAKPLDWTALDALMWRLVREHRAVEEAIATSVT